MIYLEPRDKFEKSIICIHENKIVYDYDILIEIFSEEFSEANCENPVEDALEWVNYNVIRAIPYMGQNKPIIVQNFSEDLYYDFEDEDEITINNIRYLKIV